MSLRCIGRGLATCTLLTLAACDRPAPTGGPAEATTVLPAPTTSAATATAAISTTGVLPDRVGADQAVTLGHVRVAIKRVSVGKVPLRQADGSISYADQPRLMIAVQLKNVSGKRQSQYTTWIPDLDAARSVARLMDNRGTELKRVTFGFGNNVKDRTVLDTLAPGKTVNDLLVFEVPDVDAAYLDLDLPGANCGVPGTYRFRIDAKSINRSRER